jgi:hypothetical protein
MNKMLMNVRPVISLDAAHLKSTYKGTLYAATTKSPCNEILPVAFAIINGNEDGDGWEYFLKHLKDGCPIIAERHPLLRVKYRYFTFVSDRDKGLIPALKKIFPENHSIHCSVHIKRNVKDKFGMAACKYVDRLSKTYSTAEAEDFLLQMEKVKPEARTYVEAIDPKVWRSTEWVVDSTLPPRYGITTSNNSESVNSMLDVGRKLAWLYTIHFVLEKMCERICILREQYKNTTDMNRIIQPLEEQVQTRYENCSKHEIFELNDERTQYKVNRMNTELSRISTTHRIDVAKKTCTCGEWQDYGVPCVDAMSYFF